MSRTDHHAPVWVRTLNDTSAYERHYCRGRRRDCDDLDSRDGICHRWDRDHHWEWDLRPTNDMIAVFVTAPERAYVRDVLQSARRDYNANGDTDIEPERRQRHRAPWTGGWFH